MPLDPYELAAELSSRLEHDRPKLTLLDRYYRGRQPAAYLHPEIAADVADRLRPLRINWPRVVLDSIHERLRVDGFRLTGADEPNRDLWATWQRNNLDLGQKLAHRSALKHGRCFLIVWGDAANPKQARITVESAKQVAVERDPVTGQVVAAVKSWQAFDRRYTGDATRFCTVYLPTRILRLRSTPDPALGPAEAQQAKGGWFLRAGGEIINPLGVVPVVPMLNRPDLDDDDCFWGESELEDIADPADAVNKLATDMMVTAEFYAMPRRWATGTEPATREPATDEERAKWTSPENPDGLVPLTQWQQIANRVWTLPESDAKVGQFSEADLGNYAKAINLLTGTLAALGKLPPHYVGLNGDNPASADAIRSAEASLVSTAEDKQRSFEDAWEQAMRIARRIETGAWDSALESLETVWMDPETRTKAQDADAATKLVTAGVIDAEQAQEDMGYTPVQRDRMAARRRSSALQSAAAAAIFGNVANTDTAGTADQAAAPSST